MLELAFQVHIEVEDVTADGDVLQDVEGVVGMREVRHTVQVAVNGE